MLALISDGSGLDFVLWYNIFIPVPDSSRLMHEQKFTCRTVEETELKLVSYAATKESECELTCYFLSSFSHQLVSCV